MIDRPLRRLTRMAIVLAGGLLAAVVTLPLATPVAAAQRSPSGVVTIGEDLSGVIGEPVLFDPTLSHVPQVQDPWDLAIYDTLLRPTPQNGYLPELATSAVIVDPQTITVDLRPGVTFSDGTPFDADAVKAGILRNRDSPQRGGFQPTLQDVSNIDVTAPDALTIHLSAPVAGAFYPLLAGAETFIASPSVATRGDLNTRPVGAGPFTLQQYQPGQRIVLTRNPRYWDAKDIKVHEVDFVNVAAGPQQVNALESGLVNVTGIPVGDVSTVRANPSYRVTAAAAQTQTLWMPVCKAASPLNDVRVRQALNYGIDRQAINRVVLHGLGQPQWALWPRGTIYFPRALDGHYAFDPEMARRLLAEAGYPKGFSTSILVTSGSPVISQTASIVQAEWKQIGVTVSLIPTTDMVGNLYQRRQAPMGLLPEVRGGVAALTGPFSPGSIGDLCNYDNPTLDALSNQLSTLAPGSSQAVALWQTAQNFVIKNALAVWIDYAPYVYAASARVGGVTFLTQFALPVPYYWSLTIRSG